MRHEDTSGRAGQRSFWAVAWALILIVVPSTSARPAAAQTADSIPLATIGTAPPTRTGSLPNGVAWSVDRGTWNAGGQGYVIFGGATQTWTFDQTVSLRFSVRGLTGPGECMRVPVGSVLVSLAPSHSYNPTTRLVCYTSNVPAADSFFTLSPTTSLVLVAVNEPTLGRGPGSIEVTLIEEPALSIVKSSSTVAIPPVGQTIPYSFLVTNTGNVTMTGIAVSDANTTGVTCPVTTLVPTGSTTCTGEHTVVQDDVDDAAVVNTATVVGTPPSGASIPPVPSNQVTITGLQNPALSIVKTSTATQIPPLGDPIPYTFLVSNIGDVTLTGITVTDPNTTGVTCLQTALPPGLSTTCTGSHTVVQADLDAGVVVNAATVVGTPPSGIPIPPVLSNEITIPTDQTPALSIVKSSTATTILAVGQVVPYRFIVTNTGNVTINAITVTDPTPSGVVCPTASLAPGVSTTCDAAHTVVQGDIDAGAVINTATVVGTPPLGPPIPPVPSNTITITAAQTESLSILKTTTTPSLPAVGATIPYEFLVANTGNVTMTAVAVTDPNTSGVSCPQTTLAPGAATTCAAVHTVVQADIDAGEVVNTATVIGTPPDGTPIPRVPSNEVTVSGVQNPGLSIVKSSTTASIAEVGQIVPYTFTVTNSGDTTISEIAVTDPNIADVACPLTDLPPGIATTCTATYVATTADLDNGELVNTATVTGISPGGSPLPTAASNTVTIRAAQSPALSIVKTATTAATTVGQVIPFTFTVTNTGNVTISDIVVSDPRVRAVTCPQTTLATGAALTCTADYAITQADAEAGQVINTASVVGTPPDGATLAPVTSNQVLIQIPPQSPPANSATTTSTSTTTPTQGQLPATGKSITAGLRTVLALTVIGIALTTIARRHKRTIS